MKHQILTETKFFKLLDGMDNIDPTQLQVEYHIFIGRVIDLSRQAHEQHEAMHSLVFAETELQYHPLLHLGTEHIPCMYVKKALSFIRKMVQHAKSGISNMLSAPVATNAIGKEKSNEVTPIRWTGKASDLVELHLWYRRTGLCQRWRDTFEGSSRIFLQDAWSKCKGVLPHLCGYEDAQERK